MGFAHEVTSNQCHHASMLASCLLVFSLHRPHCLSQVGELANYDVCLQVGSPPSDMSWTPPGNRQHAGSPFSAIKEDTMSRVSPADTSLVLQHVFVCIPACVRQCTAKRRIRYVC